MSATKWVTCQNCLGRGGYSVYVDEWAELFERVGAWWRRLTGRAA